MKKEREYPVYRELLDAYDFYNEELFEGLLPQCMITLTQTGNYFAFFKANNFISVKEKDKKLHEISMNVYYFALRDLRLTLSTLVHEMVHLMQYEEDTQGRSCYHNKRFAEIMESIGLMTSQTGEEGGNRVGQQMSHYIIDGGTFDKCTKALMQKGYFISFVAKINEDVKKMTIDEARVIKVPGKENIYKNEDGDEFEGKVVRCGKDEKGKDIVKIVVKEEKNWKRYGYKCECGDYTIWGKKGLDLTCNKCGEKLEELV